MLASRLAHGWYVSLLPVLPALFIYRVEDPNYHTAGDRPELVDPATLEQAGSIALRVLDSLAADPSPAQ